jgi:antitoxin HigA-1
MARLIIHPGEHLADELQALGMSANELAKALRVPTNRITEIIRGKRGISGDTALRLGRWFGTGPDIWMNLQKNYELRLAEQKAGESIKDLPTLTQRLQQVGDNSQPQP